MGIAKNSFFIAVSFFMGKESHARALVIFRYLSLFARLQTPQAALHSPGLMTKLNI
jgi:hypothetical protein